jgi:3-oxoacyl-[acyl-carrier protein] reductase
MDLGLTGRRVLVTGGTKGIGRVIAQCLVAEGADVAICARNAAEVEEAVPCSRRTALTCSVAPVDVADAAAFMIGGGERSSARRH